MTAKRKEDKTTINPPPPPPPPVWRRSRPLAGPTPHNPSPTLRFGSYLKEKTLKAKHEFFKNLLEREDVDDDDDNDSWDGPMMMMISIYHYQDESDALCLSTSLVLHPLALSKAFPPFSAPCSGNHNIIIFIIIIIKTIQIKFPLEAKRARWRDLD